MQPTILLQLENTARRFPGKLAFADLREEFTFSRLLDCARRIGSYVAAALPALGIRGVWNFSHYDLSVPHPELTVENVHLGDSLMSLGYRLRAEHEE